MITFRLPILIRKDGILFDQLCMKQAHGISEEGRMHQRRKKTPQLLDSAEKFKR